MAASRSPQKLNTPELCKSLLAAVDTVLFDCDGVLWVGSAEPIPNAAQTIDYIRNMGKRVCFVTNNSSKSRQEYLVKFLALNFTVQEDEIFTSGYVAAYYLNQCGYKGKAYLIGTAGTQSEFEMLGIECIGVGPAPVVGKLDDWLEESLDPEVGAVVVGYDQHFSYLKMIRATSYLNRPGCLFVGTNEDSRLPTTGGDIVIPGTGTFVSAVKFSAERDPVIVGKPCKPMFDCISRRIGLDPSRTLMVGDRLNTDVLFGKSNGMKTLAVLTGISNEQDVLRAAPELSPDFYATSVSEMLTVANLKN